VDSTWGLNDGLAWLPHDRALVNLSTGGLSRSINGKTSFLDVLDETSWDYRETPSEWIWRSSVTEDQLRTIARGACRLAQLGKKRLVTMWFVGLLDGADTDCLPWFQTGDIADDISPSPLGQERHRLRASSFSDLDAVDEGEQGQIISVYPDQENVRNDHFIGKLIEVALRGSHTVEIVGSPLAHPYYLISSAGVPVTCVLPPQRTLQDYNKLVRDLIPELIHEQGEVATVYRPTSTELGGYLRTKLVEESLEVLEATSQDELTSELADAQEVLDGLRRAAGITRDDLRARSREKRSRRGAFDVPVVLLSTSSSAQDAGPTLPGLEPPAPRPWQVRQARGQLELNQIPPLPGYRTFFDALIGETQVQISYGRGTIRIQTQEEVQIWHAQDAHKMRCRSTNRRADSQIAP